MRCRPVVVLLVLSLGCERGASPRAAPSGAAGAARASVEAVPTSDEGVRVVTNLRQAFAPRPAAVAPGNTFQHSGALFDDPTTPVEWRLDAQRLTRQTPFTAGRARVPATVTLPALATGAISVDAGALSARVRLEGTQPVAAAPAGATLVYPRAFEGRDVLVKVSDDGVEDWVSFADKPRAEALAYRLELSPGVAGLRLVENALELLDPHGRPRLRMSPPLLVNRARVEVHAQVRVEGCRVDTDPALPWLRKPLAPGADTCRVVLSWSAPDTYYPAVLDPTWTTTGSITAFAGQGRFGLGVTSLGNAGVLACSGYDVNVATVGFCEVYSEVLGVWTSAGVQALPVPRANFPLVFSASANRAVAVGGETSSGVLNRIDVFSPITGTWAAGPVMALGRSFASATPLATNDAQILVVGGQFPDAANGNCSARTASFLRYNVATNLIELQGALVLGRALHVAHPLPTGQVLIAGGFTDCCGGSCAATPTAEIIAPTNTAGAPVGSMARAARAGAATFLLPSGEVLVAGGYSDIIATAAWSDSERWSPISLGFLGLTTMVFGPAGAQGAFGRLANGTLVVAGGGDNALPAGATTRTYISTNGLSWTLDGPLAAARRGGGSATTFTGKVLAVGGGSVPGALVLPRTTELFDLGANGNPCTGSGLCASQLCVDGVCCNAACTGDCDACNLPGSIGTCTNQPSTTVCRAATGPCDVAETCTGSSPSCPATDAIRPNGFECRASMGACDPAEVCSGSSKSCPADVLSSGVTVCRPSAGSCDVPENCTGSSAACPADGFSSGTTVCRAANGPCDVAERCSGGAPACPADGFASATTECRAAAGACDVAERCTGTSVSCPADALAPATTECRAAAGACDIAERCTGTSVSCPADALAPATTECRAAAGACDVAERCSGTSVSCPADGFAPATTECRAAAGGCDVAERCSGGAAACPPDGFSPATMECRAAAGACDVAERCTGVAAACPDDTRSAMGTVCRSDAGACDVTEVCDGTGVSCPGDVLQPRGTVCSAYVCTGADAGCPDTCTTSTDCAPPATCVGGRCMGVRPDGMPCQRDAECQSAFCVDGVCCNTRCEGACNACNRPSEVGTCTVAPAGAEGEPACRPFVCNGQGSDCPTRCDDGAACASGFSCIDGRCSSMVPNGRQCTMDAECASGFCVDGVCCNARCAGACNACNVRGAEGSCAFVPAGSAGAPSCEPFVCAGNSAECPTVCATDADCAPPARCDSALCTARPRGHLGFAFGCSSGPGSLVTVLAALAVALFRRNRKI
ncbi:MAG: hypothetical protein SFW67_34700 [Myxococcaceae bacterium]|nr:hypothetical protein [Myxococcaceae bacterium]